MVVVVADDAPRWAAPRNSAEEAENRGVVDRKRALRIERVPGRNLVGRWTHTPSSRQASEACRVVLRAWFTITPSTTLTSAIAVAGREPT
jgi:hypothetical protein